MDEKYILQITLSAGYSLVIAYHKRYLLALERFGYDDLGYTPEDDERERATHHRLRLIIKTAADEQEYTQAATRYIQTFFKYSLFCAIRDGLRRMKEHQLKYFSSCNSTARRATATVLHPWVRSALRPTTQPFARSA